MPKMVRVHLIGDNYKVYSNGRVWHNRRKRYQATHNRTVSINSTPVHLCKLISDLFLERELNTNTVTHLDGNPMSNDVSNLKCVRWQDIVKTIKRA